MTEVFHYQINKNVPMPQKDFGNFITKYPFVEKMEVGDSVNFTDKAVYQKVYNGIGAWARKNGKTFSSRKIREGLYGIWRVK